MQIRPNRQHLAHPHVNKLMFSFFENTSSLLSEFVSMPKTMFDFGEVSPEWSEVARRTSASPLCGPSAITWRSSAQSRNNRRLAMIGYRCCFKCVAKVWPRMVAVLVFLTVTLCSKLYEQTRPKLVCVMSQCPVRATAHGESCRNLEFIHMSRHVLH